MKKPAPTKFLDGSASVVKCWRTVAFSPDGRTEKSIEVEDGFCPDAPV